MEIKQRSLTWSILAPETTKSHKNNNNLFLLVLGAEKDRVEVPLHAQSSSLYPGPQKASSHCGLTWRMGRHLSGDFALLPLFPSAILSFFFLSLMELGIAPIA